MELKVDPMRQGFVRRSEVYNTGIVVRAKLPNGMAVTADIVELTRESLLDWLLSAPHCAVNTVGRILGHGDLVQQ